MSPLHKMIIRLYDEGFEIKKVSNSKFYIKHKQVHTNKKVIVEYEGCEDFTMYQAYAKKFHSWEFNNYPHYDFLHHYEKCATYNLHRTLKNINLNATKPTMKLLIKHRDFAYDGSYVIKMESYKNLYNRAIEAMYELLESYSNDPIQFMRDQDIPTTIRYVCNACKGNKDDFIYGKGWISNNHYLNKLVNDILSFLGKCNVKI